MTIDRKFLRNKAKMEMQKSGLKHICKKYHKNEFPIKVPYGISFFSIAWRYYI